MDKTKRKRRVNPQTRIAAIDKKIAEYIIPEIPDGATIQLGLGGMANAKPLIPCLPMRSPASLVLVFRKFNMKNLWDCKDDPTGSFFISLTIGDKKMTKFVKKVAKTLCRPVEIEAADLLRTMYKDVRRKEET